MILTKLAQRAYSSSRIADSKKLAGLAAFLAIAGAVLLTPGNARAQLVFTFTQPVQTTTAGGTLSFFANIANVGAEQITINGFNPGLTASGITINDTFFANVPDTFNPGDNGVYQFFSVAVDGSTTPNSYVGLAQIDYDTATVTNQTVNQNYTVNVVAVAAPEPSSAVQLATGLLALAASCAGYGIQQRTNRPRNK